MKIGKHVVNFLERMLVRGNVKRRKAFKGLYDFESQMDVPFIDDGLHNHKFDIFYADKSNRKNICVIDIQGGSYIFGEHRDNFVFGYELLKAGFDFVAVDYVPNNGKMDTKDSIDECYQCIKFVFENLNKFKLDMDRFVLAGDSAGGHFALTLCEASDDEEYAKLLGYDFTGINFEVLLTNSPVFDFENLGNGVLSKSGMKRLFGPNYKNSEMRKLISPLEHFSSLKTPIFSSTCKKDFLRNEPMRLKEFLKDYPYPHKFVDIKSENKKVEHVHNVIRPQLPESKVVNNAMIDFVNEIMLK